VSTSPLLKPDTLGVITLVLQCGGGLTLKHDVPHCRVSDRCNICRAFPVRTASRYFLISLLLLAKKHVSSYGLEILATIKIYELDLVRNGLFAQNIVVLPTEIN